MAFPIRSSPNLDRSIERIIPPILPLSGVSQQHLYEDLLRLLAFEYFLFYAHDLILQKGHHRKN